VPVQLALQLPTTTALHHAPMASAGVEDDGNLLGLETGDLEASLDTLNAMTHEVALLSTWTSSQRVFNRNRICQQLTKRLIRRISA
jgi:GTPase